MRNGRSTTRAPKRTITGLVGLAALALAAACSSPVPPAAGTTAAAAPTTPAATSTSAAKACVPDPSAVVAKAPSATSTGALPADLVAKLDPAAQGGFTAAASPGAIVAVRTPQGTWTKAYGDSDPTTKTPMTADMHVRIGSVTKPFTGTLIMQLVEQGKVSLDDPISKYVSGVPNGDTVTLTLLGTMRSGVASYSRNPDFVKQLFGNPEGVYTVDQLLKFGYALSPAFAPGADFEYSNTNTLLLAKVVEKVTGMTLQQAYQKMIFEPLKLSQTTAPGSNPAMPAPFSRGYTLQGVNGSTPADATNYNPSWAGAAGEIVSDANDMLTFARALGTGQGLLKPATQVTRLGTWAPAGGYGFQWACADGWVGHTGELPGYNVTVWYDTTTDSSVVVAANSDIASGSCSTSPTLTDNPATDSICSSPGVRIFAAVSKAMGHEFVPTPKT
jgi:D-alanyl-D-alanine carboxypeptidase